MPKRTPPSHSSQESDRRAPALNAIATLLSSAGIDPTDLTTALEAIEVAKKATALEQETDLRFFADKTLVYEDQDAFIYRRGDSKSGRYYFRIYDDKTRKPITRSLKTTDKIRALATARILFIEIKGKIDRGERIKTLTTHDLVAAYEEELDKIISDIPRQGITPENMRLKRYFLRNWQDYIDTLGLTSTSIDKIPPERTSDFGRYMLARPKKDGTPRSRELINNNISEVIRMYNRIAVKKKYISKDWIPDIERLKMQPDDSYKRDILTEEQYERYWNYLHFKYTREQGVKEDELLKRKVFQHFIGILYNTGMRPKELLGLKRKEIATNPKWDRTSLNTLLIITIRKENSKTGKGRKAVAPIKKKVDTVLKAYKNLGFTHAPEDFLFCNHQSESRSAYTRQNYYQRLKDTLQKSGLQDELDQEGKSVTLYSGRHSYACWRLRYGDVPIHLLAKQMGTSIQKIESTYGHIEVETQADVVTRAQDHIKRTGIILTTDLDVDFSEEE